MKNFLHFFQLLVFMLLVQFVYAQTINETNKQIHENKDSKSSNNEVVTIKQHNAELQNSAKETQTINIVQGWDLFSTYIIPTNPDISNVLSSVTSSIIVVKDENGHVYWPSLGFNTIGNMIIGEGYHIKTSSAVVINVNGNAVVPENYPISLPVGWSMFGYLRQQPIPIEQVVSQFPQPFDIIRDAVGHIYWPTFAINSIGNFNPGEGYMIHTSYAFNFTYPAN